MAFDLPTLESRYLDSCKRLGMEPNSTILYGFIKAKLQKSCQEPCCLQVFLDQLKDADFPQLIEVFSTIDTSEIDAVDILHESPCVLNGESVLSLMRTIGQKLRVVDLQDLPFGKDFLRDLCRRGLTCQVLNLKSSHIRKLNMIGKFMQLHTLNLDFSTSLSSFREDCFTCMPNLMRLSMCETRVANLWTTSAALAKLPSLVELRFQNCLCCNDTGPCPASSHEKANVLASDKTGFPYLNSGDYVGAGEPCVSSGDDFGIVNSFRNFFSLNDLIMTHESTTEESSDDSELDFSTHQRRIGLVELLSSVLPALHGQTNLENEVSFGALLTEEEEESFVDSLNLKRRSGAADVALKKYISHHPSPICFEKHYRECMITLLPRLRVLDNLLIKETDRAVAKIIFSRYYEFLPYNRQHKENVVSILQKREMGAGAPQLQTSPSSKQLYRSTKSQYFFSRSICAAKFSSSTWPLLYPLSKFSSTSGEENNSFRPRQFEYHPSDSSLMVFGTLDGELVIINHEIGKIVGYHPSRGLLSSILGLCWLKNYPSKLIAGSDNGSLHLYDVRKMPSMVTDRYCNVDTVTFDYFEQLTSVHVNSTDELFLASGYSKNVALYDIASGKRLQIFTDMHQENINVVKFAHHSPSIFATSSFDQYIKMWDLRQNPLKPCYAASSSRGNVMVCFSPDDHYLLASAVDNEVKQILAVDGRLHMKFEIASTGSTQNYTRSYYMNGRDYIISGSSDEHVVRVCCAQTGRRLRDISLEGRGSANSMFVQSLRGDPFRDFNMSVLAVPMRPISKSQIIKINLLASNDHAKEYSACHRSHPSYSMGG
ncbi:uncharacterized protein LOC122074488 isoform X1 [Macadamia integrifolia]|uniref:uncharacterized protein LOC122074488 isoform X1 n=3 Tax=Macadamia integrifolia TaxID=60698 RepID=UPI001C4F6708|nr:uncharacterized protein LOC122074488 isoform X1 [Macadamia integrifolia]XP_042495269.1 uncharacterized protein LOC122074488 isoform X1 [Macadamia integrifolia]